MRAVAERALVARHLLRVTASTRSVGRLPPDGEATVNMNSDRRHPPYTPCPAFSPLSPGSPGRGFLFAPTLSGVATERRFCRSLISLRLFVRSVLDWMMSHGCVWSAIHFVPRCIGAASRHAIIVTAWQSSALAFIESCGNHDDQEPEPSSNSRHSIAPWLINECDHTALQTPLQLRRSVEGEARRIAANIAKLPELLKAVL